MACNRTQSCALVVGAALGFVVPTAHAAVGPHVRLPAAGELLVSSALIRAQPSAHARVVRVLRQFRADSQFQIVLAIRARRDAHRRWWYELSLPARPNGQRGWVRGDIVDLHRMQNRIDVVIATNEANWGIAVDSTHAYFTSGSLDPSAPGAIRRVPKLGGTVETLVNTSTTVLTVRVDSQNVYYRDSNGSVWGAAKSGGPPHLVSTGNAGRSGSDELDVNALVAWWIWNGGFGGQPGLYRANADGTGWTAVETSSDSTWFGPRVDDTAVYYFHGGTLIKRLK